LFQKLSTLIRYMLVLSLSAPSYHAAPAQENNSHNQIVHENSIAPNKISKDRSTEIIISGCKKVL
jgi:hypothetical protein